MSTYIKDQKLRRRKLIVLSRFIMYRLG